MRMAYRECREPVEEPELYSEGDGGMPLHYRVYLVDPRVAVYGGVVLLLVAVVGRDIVRIGSGDGGRHRGRYETRGKEN